MVNGVQPKKFDHKTTPQSSQKPTPQQPEEFGGTKGPEPTRYGDWEHKGRCTDF